MSFIVQTAEIHMLRISTARNLSTTRIVSRYRTAVVNYSPGLGIIESIKMFVSVQETLITSNQSVETLRGGVLKSGFTKGSS